MPKCRFCEVSNLRWVDLNNLDGHVPGPMDISLAPRWKLRTTEGVDHFCDEARRYYTAKRNNNEAIVAEMDILYPPPTRPNRPPTILNGRPAPNMAAVPAVVPPLESLFTNPIQPITRQGGFPITSVSDIVNVQPLTVPNTFHIPVVTGDGLDEDFLSKIIFRAGGWVSGITYYPGDAIRYAHANYMCKRVHLARHPPGGGAFDQHWLTGAQNLHTHFTGHDLPPGSPCMRTVVSKKTEQDKKDFMDAIQTGKRNIKLD